MSGSNDHIGGNIRPASDETLAEAANILRSGKLVAVPTETVYGLAADATNADAVAEIYRVKGRPDFNPLIVHAPDLAAVGTIGRVNPLANKLAKAFWPGPLTLVVPAAADSPIAPAVTAGLDTIAIRCPAHPVALELLEKSGLLLAAPSANRSGMMSPTTARHVSVGLGDRVPQIVDGGPCPAGLESTIVAIGTDSYEILRHGPATPQMIANVAGQAAQMPVQETKITAPGQLASHYSPSKPLRLNARSSDVHEFHIGFGDIAGAKNLSRAADLAQAASRLFAYLHIADDSDRTAIAVAPIPNEDIGLAINDRLKRAATA